MFNVLPDILRGDIKKEYHLRLFLVLSFALLFLEISFLLLLFPTWIISSSREQEAMSQVESLTVGINSKNGQNVSDTISSINTTVGILDSTLSYPPMIPIVHGILLARPASLHITEFRYSSSGTGATITVSGVSETREALVNFVKLLNQSGNFDSVDLPISNLAKDVHIPFSVNLTATLK